MQNNAYRKLSSQISNMMSNSNQLMTARRTEKEKGEYDGCLMAGRPPLKPPTKLGAHLASLRKQAGLSQADLAQIVGIPQRTVSFYERQAEHLPSNLLPKLAEVLGVSLEELLGVKEVSEKRRGPQPKIELQFEKIRCLPQKRQKFVSQVIDELLSS